MAPNFADEPEDLEECSSADTPVPIREGNEIEQILNDIGGSFGKFQLFNYMLFSIPMTVIGITALTYVFTTLNLEYR